MPGLRVLNVNTNPWIGRENGKGWPAQEGDDPAQMFEYMRTELSKARKNKERVILQGHIPPGYSTRSASEGKTWTDQANNEVEAILANNADILVGFFHGHEHSDAFRLHRDANGAPTVMSYLTPAGAPLNQNPGFRSYTFDRKSLELVDYNQYYLDLDKANAANKMTWQLEYSAKEYFGLESLKPEAWESLHLLFLNNDTAFQKFAAINYVQYDLAPCKGSCKAWMTCALFAVTTPEMTSCIKSFGYRSIEELQRVYLVDGGAVHSAVTHHAGTAEHHILKSDDESPRLAELF